MSADRPVEDLIVNNFINMFYYLKRLGKTHAEINELILVAMLRSVKEAERLIPEAQASVQRRGQ